MRKHGDKLTESQDICIQKHYIHVQVMHLSSFMQVFSQVLKIILLLLIPEAVVKWAFVSFSLLPPCPDMATKPPPQTWLLCDWNSML